MIVSLILIGNWAALSYVLASKIWSWDLWIQLVALIIWFVGTMILAFGLSIIRHGDAYIGD